MNIFSQQPLDVLDYGVDLTKWLNAGDSVTSATATSTPSGLTTFVTQETTSEPKVWVSGGVNGSVYKITMGIVTLGGRTKEFEFKLAVEEI